MRLPPVLSERDLPTPELHAATLDGELFRLDRAFTPVDEVEAPRHRARAVHAGLSDRLIAEQHSAAWIWGAIGRPPARHQLCVAMDARVRLNAGRGATVREVVIEPGEIATLDGLQLTAPLRTAVDLARFSPRFGQLEESAAVWLMNRHGFGVQDCLDDLDRRRNLPRKRIAAQRLLAIRRG